MNRNVPVKVGPQWFSFHVEKSGQIVGTDIYLGNICEPLLEKAYNPVGRFYYIARSYRYYNSETKELHLPLYYLERIVSLVESCGGRVVETQVPLSYGLSVDIPLIPNFKPKDERQEKCIAYLLSSTALARGLELQTGGGKTAAAIAALASYGKRAMICQTGMSKQWLEAIKEYTLLKDEDIFVVEGADSFHKLMGRIDKSLHPKIIIMSIPTLRSYANGGNQYVKYPAFENILDYLKVGVRIIDEGHLNFHANLSVDIRLNASINIVLTATFETGNPEIREIFDRHYPESMRFGGEDYKRYVNVRMFAYKLPTDRPNQLPKNLFKSSMGYSHAKFEDWALNKGSAILERVMQRVYEPILDSVYFNIHDKGEKLLVLASTLAMCDYLADHIRKRYQQYTVGVFVAGSDPAILTDCDIIVSTPTSAGTGRDIKMLRSMFVTVSVRSSPLNKQMKGRLRELKSGNTPEYAMCFAVDIPGQVAHAEFREMILAPLALTFNKYQL